MATKDDSATVDVIYRITKTCCDYNLKPEALMCDGATLYFHAIKAMRRIGTWTIGLLMLGIVLTIIFCIAGFMSMPVWQIIVYIIAIVLLGAVSLNFYYLKTTPAGLIIYMILTTILAPFAMPLFLAAIMIFPIIVALVRWSTYSNWFNDVKKRVREFGVETVLMSTELQFSEILCQKNENVQQKTNNHTKKHISKQPKPKVTTEKTKDDGYYDDTF